MVWPEAMNFSGSAPLRSSATVAGETTCLWL